MLPFSLLSGGFSTVFVATHIETDVMYAVKHIKKYEEISEHFTWEQEERLLVREVDSLRRVTGCSKGRETAAVS